jgi:hypothetical protein
LLGAGDCCAFWGRDGVPNRWTEKPVSIEGVDLEWGQMEALESSGLSFRARNDSANLYLMVAAANREARRVLTGACGQDVTLWFLGPNGKSRSWGLRLAFNRREGPAGEADPGRPAAAAEQGIPDGLPPRPDQEPGRGFPSFKGVRDVEPEMVLAAGVEVSTPLPSDIGFHAALSGRDPSYTMRIPLSRLDPVKGKSISMDFLTSEISAELKSQFEARAAGSSRGSGGGPSQGGGPMGGGGMGRGPMGGGMGRSGRGGAGGPGGTPRAQVEELPEPLNLRLSIQLARNPAHE